jgi:Glutamate decarboxylase and related PLP-dependent proteins
LLYDAIEERGDFENLHEPESNILCFRYLGEERGKRSGSHTSAQEMQRIDELNQALRPLYNREGTGWITATMLDGRPVLRVTMMNPRTGAEHIRALLEGLTAKAKELGD